MSKLAGIFSMATLLSACAVGPDYQPPEPVQLEQFAHDQAPDQAASSSGESNEQRFWQGFADPLLANLIKQTMNDNQSLQAALARYQEAEALLRGSRRDQLPSVTAGAGVVGQRLAEVERTRPDQERVELYQAGVALSWELDLFGRLHRATKASTAELQAAERRLATSSARIGIATADLFPRFTLGALLGSLAGTGSDLFTGGAQTGRVALGIDWSFLDRAMVQARIDAADARYAELLADYRQTVLLALEETETWLLRYQQSHERVALLQSATDAATQAVEQARDRYDQGFIGYFELLAAEQELTAMRDSLVQSQTAMVLAMVNVYRALAGAPVPPSV